MKRPMTTCLKCHSRSVISGHFVSFEGYPAEFRLDAARIPRLKLQWLPPDEGKSKACLNCGFVWNSIAPPVIRSLVDAAAPPSPPPSSGPELNSAVKACSICCSESVVSGEYVCRKKDISTEFRPDGVRVLKLVWNWIPPHDRKFTACLNCGCVCNLLDPPALRAFVKENCKSSVVEKYGLDQ